ncbi:MAG: hypothetical protein SFV32_09940 [Opitutaceae bacterium]|nr:hypothetical protein [Opitutaceae bacterium]
MKLHHISLPAILFLIGPATLPADTGLAESEEALRAKITDTVSATNLSRKAIESLIRSSVQSSVSAALTGLTEKAAIGEAAKGLGVAASSAAPLFAEEIIDAIITLPSIVEVEGLGAEIALAIRSRLAALQQESEVAEAKPGSRHHKSGKHHGGKRGEAIVSPATVKPTPTPITVTIQTK